MKPIIATFICDHCDYKVQARLTIGEDLWPPDEIHLVGDGNEPDDLLLCPEHYKQWNDNYWREHPDSVGMA